MTPEEKELLLKDLCARLPYGVIGHIEIPHMFIGYVEKGDLTLNSISIKNSKCDFITCWGIDIDYVKPYLRPMSSMTMEETREFLVIPKNDSNGNLLTFTKEDWLNEHHFDHRGLIEKGLALEAPEGMYD